MDVVLVLHREGKGEKEEARMHFYLDRILVEYANSHGNLEKIRFMIRLLSVLGYIGDSYSIEPDALFAKVTEVLVAAQEASSYASSKLSPMTDEMCARIDALSRVNVALSHFFLSVENKNAALLSDKLILTELISTISGKMSESKIEAQRISDMCDKIGVEKELKSKVIFMYGKGASRE